MLETKSSDKGSDPTTVPVIPVQDKHGRRKDFF